VSSFGGAFLQTPDAATRPGPRTHTQIPADHQRTNVAESTMAERLRAQRAATLRSEVEKVALELFVDRGFDEVTVNEIAIATQISARTFYGYFPAKEDVLQVRIDIRSEALRQGLERRPTDESPLHSLRVAYTEVLAAEDPTRLRQWISVMVSKPKLARGVLGGVEQKIHPITADFLARRLDMDEEGILARAYAGTVSGIVQASLAHWFAQGGDLASQLSESLAVLEQFERAKS
jgi:AcrR family transcriptional regulator